jgi:hypothetical protein
LAELKGRRPDEEIWHVIETRPGSNPRRALGDAVFAAAKRLGASAETVERTKNGQQATKPKRFETDYAAACPPTARARWLLSISLRNS